MGARWDKVFRGRVTLSGAAYSAAVTLVAIAAFLSANNLLFLLLAVLLSTLLISGLISRLGLAGLELQLQLPPHITAQRKTTARLRLTNAKTWMPSFSLHLAGLPGSPFTGEIYIPVLAGGAGIDEPAQLVFTRRGIHKENAFRISTRFPFGFAERRVHVTLRREVLVYPCVDPQPGFAGLLTSIAGELEAKRRGQGSDFYRIRPYELSESARHVDWRATAHTGSLQVREFARDEEHVVCLVLDLDISHEHLAFLERAIDCCAYLAWNLWMRGARLRMISQNLDLRVPENADIYGVLKFLALAGPLQGVPLAIDTRPGEQVVGFSATRQSEADGLRWVRAEDLPLAPS